MLHKIREIFKNDFYSVPDATKDTHNTCPDCDGTGHEDIFLDCDTCKGTGIVKKTFEELYNLQEFEK